MKCYQLGRDFGITCVCRPTADEVFLLPWPASFHQPSKEFHSAWGQVTLRLRCVLLGVDTLLGEALFGRFIPQLLVLLFFEQSEPTLHIDGLLLQMGLAPP